MAYILHMSDVLGFRLTPQFGELGKTAGLHISANFDRRKRARPMLLKDRGWNNAKRGWAV